MNHSTPGISHELKISQHVRRNSRCCQSGTKCHSNGGTRLRSDRLDVDSDLLLLSERFRRYPQLSHQDARCTDPSQRRRTDQGYRDVVLRHPDPIFHSLFRYAGRHSNGLRVCSRRCAPSLQVSQNGLAFHTTLTNQRNNLQLLVQSQLIHPDSDQYRLARRHPLNLSRLLRNREHAKGRSNILHHRSRSRPLSSRRRLSPDCVCQASELHRRPVHLERAVSDEVSGGLCRGATWHQTPPV